ncbi:MAG: hypothetical protein O2968_08725 [Acidobacteria bacterium]|nr:hypothetical protein [Acidobacteriota bacterium]
MTRLLKKAAKKAAAAPKKAAKAALRNKTATKVATAKKAAKTVNKKASRKVVTNAGKPAKAASSKAAPKKEAAKRPALSKPAVKPTVVPRKAKKPAAAKKPVRRVSKAPPAAPRSVAPAATPAKPPKPTPAQIEELSIAKDRRKAQERQADYYDKASRAFQTRRFQQALMLFEKAAEGPDSTLSDRARVHVSISQRHVKPHQVKLKTADEFYHYGIRLINERRFDEAEKSLNQALKIQPRGAHIHFAAAILSALTKDTAGTYKSLKRAMELDPGIRVSALNDTDLAAAAKDPAISQLLHGNSASNRGR